MRQINSDERERTFINFLLDEFLKNYIYEFIDNQITYLNSEHIIAKNKLNEQMKKFENGINNDLEFEEGVIGMARSDYTVYSPSLEEKSYNSGSSQFFIMTEENSALNGMYTAFGKVIEGLDIVHTVENVEVEYNSKNDEISTPVNPVIIESIRVDTKNIDYGLPEILEPIDLY